MPRPRSNDFRKRVGRADLADEPMRPLVAMLGVSVSSILKWLALNRATWSVTPGRIDGRRPGLVKSHRDRVHASIDATLRLIIDRLQDRLVAVLIMVCLNTIWRFLKREGLSLKALFTLEQARKRAR